MADRLKRLLETEAELDALLLDTRERADALVQAARTDAEARVLRHERDIEQQKTALRERLGAEYERVITEIESAASREVEKLDGLSPETVSDLVHHVVALLVGSRVGGEP